MGEGGILEGCEFCDGYAQFKIQIKKKDGSEYVRFACKAHKENVEKLAFIDLGRVSVGGYRVINPKGFPRNA